MTNSELVPGFDDLNQECLGFRLEKLDEVPGCLVAHLQGSFDSYNSNKLGRCLLKAIEAGYIRLIIDFTQLDFMTDGLIGSFIPCFKDARLRGGDIIFVGLSLHYTQFHITATVVNHFELLNLLLQNVKIHRET